MNAAIDDLAPMPFAEKGRVSLYRTAGGAIAAATTVASLPLFITAAALLPMGAGSVVEEFVQNASEIIATHAPGPLADFFPALQSAEGVNEWLHGQSFDAAGYFALGSTASGHFINQSRRMVKDHNRAVHTREMSHYDSQVKEYLDGLIQRGVSAQDLTAADIGTLLALAPRDLDAAPEGYKRAVLKAQRDVLLAAFLSDKRASFARGEGDDVTIALRSETRNWTFHFAEENTEFLENQVHRLHVEVGQTPYRSLQSFKDKRQQSREANYAGFMQELFGYATKVPGLRRYINPVLSTFRLLMAPVTLLAEATWDHPRALEKPRAIPLRSYHQEIEEARLTLSRKGLTPG